jgi:hypothetical protein
VLLSSFKSDEELLFLLKDMERVAVFSCNVCANLNGTGGPRGLALMEKRLASFGKTIVKARTVNICCSEEIMRQAIRFHLAPVRESCDGLIMLSCAGGVKTAFLCEPGVPVVTALDSMGSGTISRQESPIVKSRCVACGQCVISYTGGICPVSECPAKKKYGPCKKAPLSEEEPCAVLTDRPCVFREIQKRGNLTLLKELEAIHQHPGVDRVPPAGKKPTPPRVRALCGWFMARIPSISRFIDLVN